MNLKEILKIDEASKFKKRGGRIGTNCNLYGANLDYGHSFLITIGNNVTLSHCTILAHDASTKKIIGYSKIGKIVIEDNVFVGINTIVLPNVTIGANSIIGAGSVVTKDIPSNCVAAGNPAKVICSIEEFEKKYNELKDKSCVYDKKWTQMTEKDKNSICQELNGIGFVK